MATLNTLRTRFGVVLSAVIAVALLAFIFSLGSEMGFSGNDPVIAEIDGQSVTYTDYQSEYNNIVNQSGLTEISEQQAEQLYNATWQALISKYVLEPGFEMMGIDVSEEERMAIIRGEIPTQAFYSAFADPTTGMYSIEALNGFLFSSQGNPQAEAMWAELVRQALIERALVKYVGLVAGGSYVNSLEVADGVRAANKSFAGRWGSKKYSDVADSLVSVSQAEIREYYNKNKASYKRLPTRTISYVEFNVDPSTADKSEIQKRANELANDLSSASDIRKFIRESRSGSVASNYVSAEGLLAAEAKELVAGKTYGPVESGNEWKISRVESSVVASDTLSIRHIVLSYTDEVLADSLMMALSKATDAEFASAAARYSVYSQSAQNGGDIGAVPFSAFTDEFATALAPIRKGGIAKVESGDMIQLIRAYDAGKRVKHYRVATINLPIIPSQTTRTAAHNAAGLFAVSAKGGVENFSNAVNEATLASHKADLNSATRVIAAVTGSQEVARWAHRANLGDVSEIFKVDDGYLVAMLTGINDSEYFAMSEVEGSIKRTLLQQKKYELLSSQLSGSTLEAMIESIGGTSGEFENVNYGSYYVSGVGVEPRVVGAITTSESGVLSAPVEGNSSLVLFVVDKITESEEQISAESEKVRIATMQQQLLQQSLFGALESMANAKDMRGANL
ncbi:MAG: peptidylprolyl isomerase [Rikenellaceae bacterium]